MFILLLSFTLPLLIQMLILMGCFWILSNILKIHDEAEDIDSRVPALMTKETLQNQQDVKTVKTQMETVLQEFESQLRNASFDQLNWLIRKSESAIASILDTHSHSDDSSATVGEIDSSSYTPQVREQVSLKKLRDKLATVVEAPEDDETVLVQYGNIKVRVKKTDIKPIPSPTKNAIRISVPRSKQQVCSKP